MLWFYLILAQVPPETLKAIADEAAQKDFKWWFAALFILFVISGCYIFKLQSQQLNEQRISHAALTKELMSYLREDHTKAVSTLDQVGSSLRQMSQTLGLVAEALAVRKHEKQKDHE